MNPDVTMEALEPIPPTKGASRVWRIVLIVVAAQLLIVALGMVFFTAMGLANDGVGGCGGA
jgi:hypothetical protein